MTENPYLVGLRLAGKKVVVVGGGTVAQRRLPLLIASGADVHVIAPSVTPAVEAMDQITLSVRDYRDGDLDGAWYAIAATDDARVNVAVVAEAERRRIFCVRADIAVEGTAVTPASFSYAGLSVGVLAGGEHRRSAAIRSAIREALQQGVITAQSSDVLSGGVALVGGGPGDPELITVRGRRLLAQADVVVADGSPRPNCWPSCAARRSHRRGQDPLRPGHGPGRDQRCPDRTGQIRQLCGPSQRGRPLRVRPGL